MSNLLLTILQDRGRWSVLIVLVTLLGSGRPFLSRAQAAQTSGGAPPPSPREGFSAPEFTLDLLSGGQVTLSNFRGKVVIINLWATWCPPCREEMPAIEEVYWEQKDQGLEILAINTTYQDRIEDAEALPRA